MKAIIKITGLLVLVAVLVLGWRQFFPGDETQIRNMLKGLAASLSQPAKSSPVAMMLALDRVRDCFSPKMDFSIEAPGIGRANFSDREELIQAVQVGWSRANGLKVEFCDIVVQVIDGESATSELTARATQPGATDFYLQEFKLDLKKRDQKWRIVKISPVEVFSR